jgi:hypothetical protein
MPVSLLPSDSAVAHKAVQTPMKRVLGIPPSVQTVRGGEIS